jgi:hypothetical protein
VDPSGRSQTIRRYGRNGGDEHVRRIDCTDPTAVQAGSAPGEAERAGKFPRRCANTTLTLSAYVGDRSPFGGDVRSPP